MAERIFKRVNIEIELTNQKDFKSKPTGAESQKDRPGVVISNDKQNQFSGAVIMALITSQFDKVYFFEVEIEVEGQKGKILTDQIYTVDKSRLGRKMGTLSEKQLQQLSEGIHTVLELNELYKIYKNMPKNNPFLIENKKPFELVQEQKPVKEEVAVSLEEKGAESSTKRQKYLITDKSDIIISLDEQFAQPIEKREKTYEFRKYKLNSETKRM
ncbi:28113_t:CDS:2 [Gigaspora margarita]|uniref:28113_t:CDS:1 n=1 Tax=Gigaspora margarita TaxID=4874 RepID=A0ABN7VV84_GIGMA|nr:28113_t:CDS:2 [Gigaspora margarita]